MKFGKYTYSNTHFRNIGDSMQIIALENIYAKMGIDEDCIISIRIDDLSSYDGESIVLPIVSVLLDANGIRQAYELFSEKILPVYISYVRFCKLTIQEAEFLKQYEPIGCRDQFTYDECRRFGINAYLNGCITATLPLRTNSELKNGGKVFFVDVEKDLMQYVPKGILKDAVMKSHLILNNPDDCDELEEAKKQYQIYKDEARLVVTLRLHCASPCMAAGIPVILARNAFTTTLSWIDRLIPVYTHEEFKSIDWNPAPAIYEEHKERILRLVMSRIRNAYETAVTSAEISNFYNEVSRGRMFVHDFYFNEIKKKKPNREEEFNYSLWGIGGNSTWWRLYMEQNYPNAKLIHLYDKYKAGREIWGQPIEPIENIKSNLNEFLLISVVSPDVVEEMKTYLREIGKSEDTYVGGTEKNESHGKHFNTLLE